MGKREERMAAMTVVKATGGCKLMLRATSWRQKGGRCRCGNLSARASSSSSSASRTVSMSSLNETHGKILETAREALLKVAFENQVTSDKDEYIENTLEDLRRRLKGWPPSPPTEGSALSSLGFLSEEREDEDRIVLRRFYQAGSETVLVLVEEISPDDAAASKGSSATSYKIRFYTCSPTPLQLHWGVIGSSKEGSSQWLLPPSDVRPPNTLCDEEACNTDLGGGGPLQMTMVEISRSKPVDERKAAVRAGYLLEKSAQDTEGTVMYHHTYNIPEGTMIALVKAVNASYQIEVVVDTTIEQPITLHWGMSTGYFGDKKNATVEDIQTDVMVNASGEWVVPPENMRPMYSECEENSCSTELLGSNVKRAIINAKPLAGVTGISFVLKIGDEYVKNEKEEDFHIPVPAGILQELSHEATKSPEIVLQRVFALGRDGSHGRVLALVSAQSNGETMVEFFSDSPEPLILHWGVSRSNSGEWTLPDISLMHEPADSEIISGKACETQFKMAPGQMLKDLLSSNNSEEKSKDDESEEFIAYLQRACLHFKANSDLLALPFVVRTRAEDAKQIWFKDYWGNYLLPFKESSNAEDAVQS